MRWETIEGGSAKKKIATAYDEQLPLQGLPAVAANVAGTMRRVVCQHKPHVLQLSVRPICSGQASLGLFRAGPGNIDGRSQPAWLARRPSCNLPCNCAFRIRFSAARYSIRASSSWSTDRRKPGCEPNPFVPYTSVSTRGAQAYTPADQQLIASAKVASVNR